MRWRPIALAALTLTTLSGAPAAGEGDAAEGERVFASACGLCHAVETPEGARLAGRGGGAAPNLHGLPGRAAAADPDYLYSSALQEAAAAGLVWTEARFTAYMLDPNGVLRDVLGDEGARGRMVRQVEGAAEARDVWAYLRALSEPRGEGGPAE